MDSLTKRQQSGTSKFIFVANMNNLLNEQSSCRRFKTPLHHRNHMFVFISQRQNKGSPLAITLFTSYLKAGLGRTSSKVNMVCSEIRFTHGHQLVTQKYLVNPTHSYSYEHFVWEGDRVDSRSIELNTVWQMCLPEYQPLPNRQNRIYTDYKPIFSRIGWLLSVYCW